MAMPRSRGVSNLCANQKRKRVYKHEAQASKIPYPERFTRLRVVLVLRIGIAHTKRLDGKQPQDPAGEGCWPGY
jgi:hypothetical protein